MDGRSSCIGVVVVEFHGQSRTLHLPSSIEFKSTNATVLCPVFMLSPTLVSDLFSARSETVSDLFCARPETN